MEGNPKHHQSEDHIRQDYEWVLKSIKDPACFRFLYEKYYDRILNFVYQRVQDKDTAYDIASQVFLKAMVYLPKYKFKGLPFSSFLFRIALNEMTTYFRKNSAERVISIEEGGFTQIISEIQAENNDDEIAAVLKMLASMEEADTRMIEMRFFDKMSFKEIGLILNITENNCKVKVYRILDKLRIRLTSWKQKR